ncbi:MAG: cupin domain-containing protein [Myxococcota bacterium]
MPRLDLRAGRALAGLVLLLALAGCRTKDSTIVGHYPGPLALQDWRTIARVNQPERGEILRLVDAGRSESLSNHIAVVRSRELPHRHNRHDSTVMILDGHGTMVIGKEKRKVKAGAIFFIPRGTVHSFSSESKKPSVALVVFAPPFDGQDREIVRPPAQTPAPAERNGDKDPAGKTAEEAPSGRLPGRPQPSPGAVLEDESNF